MATSTSPFVGQSLTGTSQAARTPTAFVGEAPDMTSQAQAWPTTFRGGAPSMASAAVRPPGRFQSSLMVIALNQKRVGACSKFRTIGLGTEGNNTVYGRDTAANIGTGTEGMVCVIGEIENKTVAANRALTNRRPAGHRTVTG